MHLSILKPRTDAILGRAHGLRFAMRRAVEAPDASASQDWAWLSEEIDGAKCAHCEQPLCRWELMSRMTRCDVCEQRLTGAPQRSEDEQREAARQQRLDGCGVPPAYQLYSQGSWKGEMPPQFATFTNHPAGFWYIYGDTGRGKTHLAIAAIERIQMTAFQVSWTVFRDVPEVLAAMKRHLMLDQGAAAERDARPLRDSQLLILDDLGAERGTDFDASVIAEVLRYRHAQAKATIVTSNLTPDQLREIDAKLASRITTGLVTYLVGRDRRSMRLAQ